MSSLVTNSTMTPSEVLSLNLNDSALDLLNAAIASHQSAKVDKNDQDNSTNDASPTTTHGKKLHELIHLVLDTYSLSIFF